MQAIVETLFDAVYLLSVITIGILIPRAFALCNTGLENYTVSLGLGKWITSVTMTIFYVLLYMSGVRDIRSTARASLPPRYTAWRACGLGCAWMPQNQWLHSKSPISWGVYRNIPFALLGFLVIALFYHSAKSSGDQA